MRRISFLSLPAALLAAISCWAFESDVHFGMTQWLALKAGFNEREAATIATGSQRVDSGDMQYLDVGLMYACLGKDDIGVKRAGGHHYPTAGAVPGDPEVRAVVAGSEVAMKAAAAMTKVPPEKTGFMLLKLGEALHILQDSWAHQGVPEVPYGAKSGVDCDPTRAWGHPKARGGAGSHHADLTRFWRADTLAAAKATYDVLLQFAPVQGAKRTPQAWDSIQPRLEGFIKATTKSQKRDWFVSQGLGDVSFLEGISLPDGSKPFELHWSGRRLPPVPAHQSRQHYVDEALLDFFHRFFEGWMTTTNFAALAAELGPGVRVIKQDRGVFDTMPLSLLSRQTLACLGKRIGAELTALRFRPNIVVDIPGQEYPEEAWIGRVVRIGGLRMRVDQRDNRCVMITIDPVTLDRNPEILRVVAQERDNQFGVYGSVVAPGRIAVGDPVEVEPS